MNEHGQVLSSTVGENTPTPAPAPDPNTALMEVLKGFQEQLTSLKDDQKKLLQENELLKEQINAQNAEPRNVNVQGADFPPDPRAARSVVLATRPVQENPQDYRQHGKGLVDGAGLSINNSSPLSGKNRE
jgi:hypothetical protein